MTSIFLTLFFAASMIPNADSSSHELFIVLTSGDEETQMMAMVIATQSVNQDVPVRILLCSDAGYLAIEGKPSKTFAPADRSPKQLLNSLIERGVTAEVCGIFLPNRDFTENNLSNGISVASPPEIAGYMKNPNVRYFTF